MVSLHSKVCDFGWVAPDFSLRGVDEKTYTLADVRGENGLLIAFICNHCPYVLAILDRLIRDARDLQARGVGVAAICSNDSVAYPDDSFENMIKMSTAQSLPFPYLHDKDQHVAQAYNAQCTPDFFGLNSDLTLQYRGRLDASGRQAGAPDAKRELFDAMLAIAETGVGPREQVPSIGCSIKWKG